MAAPITSSKYRLATDEKVNILVVDDQPGKLLSYEAVLAELDENVVSASSGREALEHLLKMDFAVILVDVCMPELDGFELVEMIRQHHRFERTAVIFVSGVHLTDLDRLKGYQSGAVDYVSVPIVPEILRAKVAVFVDLYRKTRQLEELNSELEQRVCERTADLRKLADSLEQKVRERTVDLEEMYRELEGFSYSIAHDLRQHIRGININAAIVANDERDLLSDKGKSNLDRLIASSNQLSEVVDDLLTYARLSRQEVKRVEVDLSKMAQDVAAECSEDSNGKSLTFRIEDGLMAEADRGLLRIVLQNLIENACKYSGADAQIEIGRTSDSGDSVFFVRDNGIGFDMRFVEKLFQPFERLHRGSEYPGTGIGLANVKRVVERHGGRVWAEGEPMRGATFYFTIR